MIYEIKINTSIVDASINKALSKRFNCRGDFFHELRNAFRGHVEEILMTSGISVISNGALSNTNYLKNGVQHKWAPFVKFTGWNNEIKQEMDMDFCARYGHDDYSMQALNYLDKEVRYLSSLFSMIYGLSIGNILILVENDNYDIKLSLGDGIFSTGYSYHISRKKKKSYLCIFGIHFSPELLKPIINNKLIEYEEKKEDLDEIQLGIVDYPIMYINRVTGNLYTCSCFDGYFDISDIKRYLSYAPNMLDDIRIVDGLCHYCNGGIPKHIYGSSMYYSSFLQRYLPYHRLISRKKYGRMLLTEDLDYKVVENELREKFGFPKIGQKWLTETALYKIIKLIFSDREVIHHYRGSELQGLELDIWIPSLRLGIEYQGIQHYKVVEHWGGQEGLDKRIVNDKKKKKLCTELNYVLVEFNHTETLTEDFVRRRVAQFITN